MKIHISTKIEYHTLNIPEVFSGVIMFYFNRDQRLLLRKMNFRGVFRGGTQAGRTKSPPGTPPPPYIDYEGEEKNRGKRGEQKMLSNF